MQRDVSAAIGSEQGRWDWLPWAGLLAAWGFAFWRLWALRYTTVYTDENSAIATGMQMAMGAKLYGGIFANHQPLEAYFALPLAWLGWGRDPLAFRLLAWGLHGLAALACLASPLFQGQRRSGAMAAGAYALLFALLAPSIFGHLFLSYSLSAAFWVGALALLLAPALAGIQAPFWAAFGGAFCWSFWAFSSPAMAPSMLLQALILAAALPRGRAWRPVLLGLAVGIGLQDAWMLRYADLGAYFEQAIKYNVEVYPRFSGEPAGWALLLQILRGHLAHWADAGLRERLFMAAAPAALALALARAGRSRGRTTLLAALGLGAWLLLRPRGGHWRSLEFVANDIACAAILLGAGALWLSRQGKPWLTVAFAVGVMGFGALLWRNGAYRVEPRDDWHDARMALEAERYQRVLKALPPGSSLAALPVQARAYMQSGLPSAYKGVFVYPWDAYWQFQAGDVRPDNLCTQLKERRPALIVDDVDAKVWTFAWRDYRPPCLDAIEAGYRPLALWPGARVRPDLEAPVQAALAGLARPGPWVRP